MIKEDPRTEKLLLKDCIKKAEAMAKKDIKYIPILGKLKYIEQYGLGLDVANAVMMQAYEIS